MLRSCALILAALAASTLDWNATSHAAPATAEQRLSRITIRRVGEGTPVVLIPGLASSSTVYNDLAARVGKGRRLILVQINGFAGSAAGPTDNLLPGAVDELAAWLASNKIEKPPVIGHSMGGLMAMMLARKHPSAAGKLMIVDALPSTACCSGQRLRPRPFVPWSSRCATRW